MKTHNTVYRVNPMGFFPMPEDAVVIEQKLPAQTYSLQFDPDNGFFFKPVDRLTLPDKIYGKSTRYAERIVNTFNTRNASTGLFLVGDKGTGKTLLSKSISNICLEQGRPTVLINQPYIGDGFNTLIQDLHEPTVFIFDEFEKVYDREAQEKVLTLFDGVFPTKHLFILTTNDDSYSRTNEMLRNRPGRMFYSISFKGLDVDFVREYCEDKLINKDHINDVVRVSSIFGGGFNFDILQALVEEMNRYNETAMEAIEILNADPFASSGYDRTEYSLKVFVNDIPFTGRLSRDTWTGNPMASNDVEVMLYRQFNNDGKVAGDDELAPVVVPEAIRKLLKDAGAKTAKSKGIDNTDTRAGDIITALNLWDYDEEFWLTMNRSNMNVLDAGSGEYVYQKEISGVSFTMKFTRKHTVQTNDWRSAF